MTKRTCSIERCTGKVVGWGWCSHHYERCEYGVDPGQIRLIVKRKNWKHVA